MESNTNSLRDWCITRCFLFLYQKVQNMWCLYFYLLIIQSRSRTFTRNPNPNPSEKTWTETESEPKFLKTRMVFISQTWKIRKNPKKSGKKTNRSRKTQTKPEPKLKKTQTVSISINPKIRNPKSEKPDLNWNEPKSQSLIESILQHKTEKNTEITKAWIKRKAWK